VKYPRLTGARTMTATTATTAPRITCPTWCIVTEAEHRADLDNWEGRCSGGASPGWQPDVGGVSCTATTAPEKTASLLTTRTAGQRPFRGSLSVSGNIRGTRNRRFWPGLTPQGWLRCEERQAGSKPWPFTTVGAVATSRSHEAARARGERAGERSRESSRVLMARRPDLLRRS